MSNRVHNSWLFSQLLARAIGWALACQLIEQRQAISIAPSAPAAEAPPAAAPPATAPPVSPSPVTPPSAREDLIWEGLASVGLLLLLYYFLRLWYHGLGYDPDFLNFTTGIATLLALVSLLGIQSEWGQSLARRVVRMLNLSRLWQNLQSVCFIIWALGLLLAILFHVGYPRLSSYCNLKGVIKLEKGHYSAAVQDFRQAISLSVSNANAHYNLANAYEALHEYEQAISEYQLALELNDELWPAYNNLGRLYLVARNDTDAALTVLLVGHRQTVTKNNLLGQAVFHKNIGWVYLEKKLHQAALDELQSAYDNLKKLDKTTNVSIYLAENYRLTALVYSELGQVQEAEKAWKGVKARAQAVRDSVRCQNVLRSPSMIDCLNAEIWFTEALEQLTSQKERW